MTTAEEYANGFNDHLTKSWIWGIKQTEEQNMGDYSPFAMWYNGDRKCWTFAGFILSDQFVDLFDEDDIRFKQFENWSTVLARRKKNSGFLISSGIMRTAADRWLSCVPTKCC